MIWAILRSLICVVLVLKLIFHLTHARCKSKVCLVGRTALITGGNSGLGLELVKHLASRGCTIIIADKDDATNTIKQLIRETHNPNISSKIVDFASFKSVRLFVEDFKKSVQNLHILVNNAGIGDATSFEKTEDGIQKTMQINYFSHFLLTHKLLDLLLKSTPSRIIYSSSLTAYSAPLSEQNFIEGQLPNLWKMSAAGSYGNSKLAGTIMSRILAHKLKNTGVTSNVCHPGFVRTNIWNTVTKFKIKLCLARIWTYVFGKSPDEGVQTLLHLACANEVEKLSGKFFIECISVCQPWQVHYKKMCKKIWELSEKYVGLKREERLEEIIQRWKNKN